MATEQVDGPLDRDLRVWTQSRFLTDKKPQERAMMLVPPFYGPPQRDAHALAAAMFDLTHTRMF